MELDLWSSYQKVAFGDYNTKRLLLTTGERQHTSLNMVKETAGDLALGRVLIKTYSDEIRYITAQNLTYDLLVSIYDVNSRTMFALRLSREPKQEDWKSIARRVSMWKKPNIEIRVFGFQNGSSDLLHLPEEFRKSVKVGRFAEIDLFGTDVRHIALDLKTGVSYNLLLQNKIYRLGELACQQKKEEYDAIRSDLVFV